MFIGDQLIKSFLYFHLVQKLHSWRLVQTIERSRDHTEVRPFSLIVPQDEPRKREFIWDSTILSFERSCEENMKLTYLRTR